MNRLAYQITGTKPPTAKQKNSLPDDVKYLYHKGVKLYQKIADYEYRIISKDEFIKSMRDIENEYNKQLKCSN